MSLNLEQIVTARAHRCLRRLKNYRKISEGMNASSCLKEVDLQTAEKPLGIYENHPGQCNELILITTFGLHIFRGDVWDFVEYHHLTRLETPPAEDRQTLEKLVVHLRPGETVCIPVRGGEGRLRDAWEFVRFLDRVMEDIKKGSS